MATIQSTPTVSDVLSGTHDPNDIILGDKQDIITKDNAILDEVFGTEKKCPPLGFTLPELPDLDKLGDIADDALEEVDKLIQRVKDEAGSAEDTMKEFAGKVTDEANKALVALEKAAADLEKQVKEQAAAAWDELAGMMNDLEKAVKAVQEGVVDIGKLGMDVMEMPAKVLEGSFKGFKAAVECLKGEAGGAEESFNKTSPELKAGTKEGRGKDGATAAIAITEKLEVVPAEDGEEVSKQETVTKEKSEEIIAEKKKTNEDLAKKTGEPEKPITAVPAPIPDDDFVIPTHRDKEEYSEYMKLCGLAISGEKFVTNQGRSLTEAEQTRYDAGLPPKFVSGIILIRKFRREPPEKVTLARAQAEFDKIESKKAGNRGKIGRVEQSRKDLVHLTELRAQTDGRKIPPEAYIPYEGGPPPHPGWAQFGAWHPLSYNVQAFEEPIIDTSMTEGVLSEGPIIMDKYGKRYEKTEEENLEPDATWDVRWTYIRV